MEDGNAILLSQSRPGSVPILSPSSRKSSPRSSPHFRRLNSNRTSRYDGRIGAFKFNCVRCNRVVLWLLLITMWAYAGFYFQSRWAHADNKEDLFSGGYGGENPEQVKKISRDVTATLDTAPVVFGGKDQGRLKKLDVVLAKPRKPPAKRRTKHVSRSRIRNKLMETQVLDSPVEIQEEEIPMTNATYRFLVGPFGSLEDKVLEWSPRIRLGTCDRKGAFARLVWSRKIILVFHELSMTGAPLAMMELASEFLSCGATISAVVLNRKGGLMSELARRKIKVITDKNNASFRNAMKADLIIAGSAVCSSWIEPYLERTVLGSSQILWWIMENRREYFNRSKHLLNRVKRLIFLSESQSKQWLAWCEEEGIHLKSEPSLIPLSVNDELAFVAGFQCSLNTPLFSIEKMQEKRKALRSAVRKEMGLGDNEMLVISLSSITPGKGQLLLLESASLIAEQGLLLATNNSDGNDPILLEHDYYSRALLQDDGSSNASSINLLPKKDSGSTNDTSKRDGTSTQLLSNSRSYKQNDLKFLIGSVGLKSNKVAYVKRLLAYLSTHSNLSASVLWTPATTHVASLYAAADVYVMNSQGLGETFGRVTIEAMAFGLPVLGTDAGGTRELVEHNVTGLLHPLGRTGSPVLARNLEFLLENPSAREEMGRRGREKVKKMYLKKNMYQKFGEVLYKSMRIK